MAIDFQQIQSKIREIGAGAHARKKRLENLRAHAHTLLHEYGEQLEYLHGIVDRARETEPNIRCALPVNEPLTAHVPVPTSSPPGTEAQDVILIAADGSQINPDRHAAVQFCLINVGAIMMRLQSGKSSEVHTNSELLYGDEIETNYGTMTEGMIALKRDLRERTMLDELSRGLKGSIVSFTDGPIELWGAKDGEEAKSYHESLKSYLSVLSRLQSREVITAGYVDKPAANLVVRLLELVEAQKDPPPALREYYPLRGVSDRWLYGEKADPLLGPGERSAVFAIRSKSEKDYKGVLALHFFYLNAGTQGYPWPVRVEIPKWVVDDSKKLDLLHAVLVDQCRTMGSKPFPYLLHRAHEIAVVKHDERYQVEQMLEMELRKQFDEVDEKSYKQVPKDHQGRTRYRQ